ncbi:MAG: nucleotidyltransferase family protein [Deltaproteobacteria bacterium]|nr:nucleotidyltransferase family protein [Deltaproteobacteria bacterium]
MSRLTTPFTAVVLAGDRKPGDPVAEAAGVSCKSLIPVGGRPMVLRVLDALEEAREVESVILCGPHRAAIGEEEELHARIASGKVKWVESQATPSSSTYQVLQSLADEISVLVTTADHALLTAQMVDYFCSEARCGGNNEIVVGLALLESVMAAYPQSKRTAIRLRDGAYCSCNLFGFLTPRARVVAHLWRKVESQRKKALRLISAFGWMAVLHYLLRRPSLEEGLGRISQRLGLSAGAVVMPFPEAAVDVDTVSDWKLVESIVANRTG